MATTRRWWILATLGAAGCFRAAAFVEKPSSRKAKAFVARGDYFWNAGIFLFKASRFLEELERFEPAVLAVMSDSLHQAGYSPVAASSAPEALRLLAARREDLQLIVMDLVMPEMSGVELLRHVRKATPELRVLVTSGYMQSDMEPALRELGVTTLLEKPFTSAELLDRARQALAAGEKKSPTPRPRMSPRRTKSE